MDISSFETIEIKNYFSEFSEFKKMCKYNNCLHYKEPVESCFVQQVVNKGLINVNRYSSYVRLIEDVLKE